MDFTAGLKELERLTNQTKDDELRARMVKVHALLEAVIGELEELKGRRAPEPGPEERPAGTVVPKPTRNTNW